MKKRDIFLALFCCCLHLSYSQSGALDSSFGNNGIIRANLGANYNYPFNAKKVLIDPKVGIYLVTQTYIAKRLSNGLPDSAYGNNGFSTPSEILVEDAALQQDGKLVLVGNDSGSFAAVRYNTNGSPDTTFGNNGKQITDWGENSTVSAVAIQNDGKIVVAGYRTMTGGRFGDEFDMRIARYNDNGILDSSFSEDGRLEIPSGGAKSMAIQTDGKIVITAFFGGGFGDFQGVVRINTDGRTDTTFNHFGRIETGVDPEALAIQVDGKILVSGVEYNGNTYENVLVRYNSDGSPDNTFNENGKQVSAFRVKSIAVQNDDKIVTAGDTSVVRYSANGSIDPSFGKNGIQSTNFSITSAVLDPLRKIVVTGTGFARLDINGNFDKTFNKDGKLPVPVDPGSTNFGGTKVQTNGKIIVFGSTSNGNNTENIVARYNTNGSLDSTFSEDGIQVNKFTIASLAVQNDGKIVVAGDSSVARYNSDGNLDNSFSENGTLVADFGITGIALQSDEKIVVIGTAMAEDKYGYPSLGFTITRYNTNGRLDISFGKNGKVITPFLDDGGASSSGSIYLIAIRSDGKILVAGKTGDAFIFGILLQYNTDGTPDSSFGTAGRINIQYGDGGYPTSIALGGNNNIVVAGGVNYRGSKEVVLTKLGPGFFQASLNLPFSGYSVAVQDDGKIIMGGPVLARFNADGNIDSTFGVYGKQPLEVFVNDMAIANNALFTVGSSTGQKLGNNGVITKYILANKSATPPTVSLTTPTNNATRLAPANFWLTATASDADGTISKVEFYNGSHLLHTEYVVPYGFKMRDLPVGNYTFTAKAYDNSGFVTTSAPVHISVVPNKPPIVSITKPVNNQSFAAPGYIHLEAEAKDVDGRIARVEFYNGSTLIRTEYYPPYTYHWTNVPKGTYTITAVGVDNWAARTTSAPVTIRVVNPPLTTANKPSLENDKIGVNDLIDINLAPNPATNIVNIHTKGLKQNKQATLQVISSSGAIIKTMQTNSSSKTIQLDISKLTSGVYTIKMISGDKVLNRQFVKL